MVLRPSSETSAVTGVAAKRQSVSFASAKGVRMVAAAPVVQHDQNDLLRVAFGEREVDHPILDPILCEKRCWALQWWYPRLLYIIG